MHRHDRARRAKIEHEAEGYLELGMAQQALATLGRLGDPAHYNLSTLLLWGECLRSLDRTFEALVPLERAAQLAPDDIRVHLALGWCYKRTGRLDLAIRSMETALAVEPDEALLQYNLACYLTLAGHKRRALGLLSRALTGDSFYRKLAETETDFDSIRSDPEFKALCQGTESAT
jgi:Flp pilus assembly protein TadD